MHLFAEYLYRNDLYMYIPCMLCIVERVCRSHSESAWWLGVQRSQGQGWKGSVPAERKLWPQQEEKETDKQRKEKVEGEAGKVGSDKYKPSLTAKSVMTFKKMNFS